MKKLISNKAAKAIREKHTSEEIENGIIKLERIEEWEIRSLLAEKLLEEMSEFLFASPYEREEELDDIILICNEIKKPDRYSEGWVLVNSRGHTQEK